MLEIIVTEGVEKADRVVRRPEGAIIVAVSYLDGTRRPSPKRGYVGFYCRIRLLEVSIDYIVLLRGWINHFHIVNADSLGSTSTDFEGVGSDAGSEVQSVELKTLLRGKVSSKNIVPVN